MGAPHRMALIFNFLFVMCFIVLKVSSLYEEVAGPYDLALTRISECDKKGPHSLLSNVKVGKFNRSHLVYNGVLDFGTDLDDTIQVRVLASNKGTNGRYNNVIDAQYKICDLVRTFAMDIFLSVYDHCNQTYMCPTKRLNCEMKNWVVDYNLRNIPALPYGDYRCDIIILKIQQFKKPELFSCLRTHGTVTPKMEIQPTTNQRAKKKQ
ncbi:uncharacterized protein LOC111058111 [Nilaparvata lugens]|uniref:uncharacterized protein LOC111058111 n=1 Tax=Nilaparvata lugens TaxID=108931 RepID=UPI00193D1478|nr:uncharacterized protein LOC111058111 [Nilaparvata lugens]